MTSVGYNENQGKIILTARRVVAYIVLGLLAFVSIFPIYILTVYSTLNHSQISDPTFRAWFGLSFFDNLAKLWQDTGLSIQTGFGNSFVVAACSALLCIYFSAFTAYGIHVYDFPGKKFTFTFIMIIMMVPAQVSALGFIRLISSMNLMNSLLPLIIPSIAAPVTFYFMKQYMEGALPLEIVEAARIDGCHELRIFNSIILPILKPAFAVQAIFTFVVGWNNYFMPAMILSDAKKKTLPVIMAIMRNRDPAAVDNGELYFLIMFSILPVVVVYLILSKFIIGGVTLGAVKG